MEKEQNKIEEEQEVYYSLEDGEDDVNDENMYGEDENDLDTSGPNYSQASYDENDRLNDRDSVKKSGFSRNPFVLMIKTLFNPVEGWKDIRRMHLSQEEVWKKCFLPLIFMLAIANFATLFYFPNISIGKIIGNAFVSFMAYFIGYFCIIILLRFLVPRKCLPNIDSDFTKTFVTVNLSSLSLFFIFIEMFPMFWAILIFLPLWTIYSICKGIRFFRFPEDKRLYCTSLLCILIVAMPSLIEFCLNEIIF